MMYKKSLIEKSYGTLSPIEKSKVFAKADRECPTFILSKQSVR